MSKFVSLKSLVGKQEYQCTCFFDSTNQIKIVEKILQDEKLIHFDDATCILNGWQPAFSNKYCPSSKILTETANKALFRTQKPRIYVTINNLK